MANLFDFKRTKILSEYIWNVQLIESLVHDLKFVGSIPHYLTTDYRSCAPIALETSSLFITEPK